MQRRSLILLAPAGCLAACAGPAAVPDVGSVEAEVTRTELAFAKTMADRDHAAFVRFLSEETVFVDSGTPRRGKAVVAEQWRQFFVDKEAPFSWRPDQVLALPSGKLAQSTGPVSGPDGVVFARFQSIWRLEEGGVWRIVFDRGAAVCAPARS